MSCPLCVEAHKEVTNFLSLRSGIEFLGLMEDQMERICVKNAGTGMCRQGFGHPKDRLSPFRTQGASPLLPHHLVGLDQRQRQHTAMAKTSTTSSSHFKGSVPLFSTSSEIEHAVVWKSQSSPQLGNLVVG